MKKVRGTSGNNRKHSPKLGHSAPSHKLLSENELLRQNLELFRTVFERISDAFVALDTHWCYTYMNKKAGEIFQRDPDYMIGKNIWTEFPEGIGQPFYKAYYKAMETQEYTRLEDYYPPWDKWFENHIYPTPDGLSIYFNDITERKREEENIRVTYQRLLKAEDLGKIGYWELMPHSNILWGSQKAMELFGFNSGAGEISFDKIEPLIPEIEKIRKANKNLMKYGKKYETEILINPADGSHSKFLSVIGELDESVGRPNKLLGVLKDITDQKIAEEKIINALKKITNILESISDGFFTVDKGWNITYVNKEAEEIMGNGRENILNHNLWQILAGKITDTFYSQLHTSMREGIAVQFEDYYAPTEVWIKVNVYPSEDGLSLFFQNITEAKRQEKLNKLEKDTLELYALQNPPIEEIITYLLNGLKSIHPTMLCSVLKAKDGRLYNWASPHLPKEYNRLVEGTEIGIGYGSCGSAAFLRKKVEVENFYTDPYWEKYIHLIEGFPMKSCWSYPIIDSKQHLIGTFAIYHNTVKTLTKPEESSIQRVQTILVHIIEKVLAENVAKAFRDKIELIFNVTKDIVFLISVKPGLEYEFDTVNNEFIRISGLERNQVEGKSVREVIPEPTYSRSIQLYKKAIDSGETITWEETVKFPAGTRTGLITISPVYDKNKVCINLIGSVHDISERKKYELEIKHANNELKNRIQDLNDKNKMLEDIAWVQSHKVRAPLARILGLIELLNIKNEEDHEMNELLFLLKNSALELDSVIKEIVLKTS